MAHKGPLAVILSAGAISIAIGLFAFSRFYPWRSKNHHWEEAHDPNGFLYSWTTPERAQAAGNYFGYGEYITEATNLARHGAYVALGPPPEPVAVRPPLYPLLLTPFVWLGFTPRSILYIQLITGSLALAAVIYMVGRELAGSRIAALAALLFPLDLIHEQYLVTFQAEGLFMFFLLLSIFWLVRSFRAGKEWQLVPALAALAFSMLARPTTVPFLPLYLLVFFVAHIGRLKLRRLATLFGFGFLSCAIVLAPWVARNLRQYPGVSPLITFATIGTFNLFEYNAGYAYAASHGVSLDEARRMLYAEVGKRAGLGRPAASAEVVLPAVAVYAAPLAREVILEQPFSYLLLHIKHSLWFFTGSSVRLALRNYSLVPERFISMPNVTLSIATGNWPAVRSAFQILGPWWTAAFVLDFIIFSIAGFLAIAVALVARIKKGRSEFMTASFLGLLILGFALVSAFIYEGPRHRYPLEPLLLILGLQGAAYVYHLVRRGRAESPAAP